MTQPHPLNEGGMGQPTHREAIGSINILREEWNALLVNTHHQRRQFYPDGSKFLDAPKGAPGLFPASSLIIDPEQLAAYQQMIEELRHNGASIIFVIPPVYGATYRSAEGPLDQYFRQTRLVQPGDQVIDFNSPAYGAFCNRVENFDDGIHLSEAASVELSAMLDRELQQRIAGASK